MGYGMEQGHYIWKNEASCRRFSVDILKYMECDHCYHVSDLALLELLTLL